MYLWLPQRKYFIRFWRISWKLCWFLGRGGLYCSGHPSQPLVYLRRWLWSAFLGRIRLCKIRLYQQPSILSSDTENFRVFLSYFWPHSGTITSHWSSPSRHSPQPPPQLLSPSEDLNLWSREQDGLVLRAPSLTLSKLSPTHLHYMNGSVNQTYYLSPLVFKLRKGKQLL